MKFSITGGNGFIGVHLIHHLLLKGHEVSAIKRTNASLDEFNLVKKEYPTCSYQKLVWVDVDYQNPYALDEVFESSEIVIHLAGFISYLEKDETMLLESNVRTTQVIVNSCLRTNINKLIYCSSIAAISKSGDGKPIDETVEWDSSKPHSLYGYTKYLGECEVMRGKEEGLNVAVINPGIVLGYGNWDKGSNKLFKNAFENFKFYSKGITGFIGVNDVVNSIIHLTKSTENGGKYILVSENLSYHDVACLMADSFKKPRPKYEVKGFILGLVQVFVTIKEMLGIGGLISKETTRAAIAKNYFDNSKLIELLPFQLTPIKDVIEDATKSYKKALTKK